MSLHQFQDIKKNISVDCDVCIVGSGAGGGSLAHQLVQAGLRVVLVEEGGYHETRDYNPNDTVNSITKLYRDAGAGVILGNPQIIYSEGRCVGGSTVVNGGMCWRTPEKVLKRWEWQKGLVGLGPKKLEPYFQQVEEKIHASSIIPEAQNQESELLRRGAESLKYRYSVNTRSAKTCVGANHCIMGCPTGAKQSVLTSFIPDFLKQGGELFAHCRVEKVLTQRRIATGIEGYFIDPVTKKRGSKLKVKAPVVVVSGGAVQTPALLKKSGIRDEARLLGKNLIVHPNAKVLAVFDEKVNAWNGVDQNYQITEYFDEGILMAINSGPPGVMALAMPFSGVDLVSRLKDEFHHMAMGGALIEDNGLGDVKVFPGGIIQPYYQLSQNDFEKSIWAVGLLAEVFFAAGARKCYLPFHQLPEIHSVDEIPKIYKAQIRKQDLELLTVHIMGTAQMGNDPKHSVVNSHGEFHNVKGLFISDASVFPSSIGVNPQVTIMALALRAADYIANEFRNYL